MYILQTGVVKVYFNNRGFGFVRTESGKEIFFHITEGYDLEEGDEQPEFSKRRARDPQAGDRLIFQMNHGQKGPKACPWGYAEDYVRVQAQIANRPSYRVLEQYQFPGSGPQEPKVLWQGTNIKDLCRKYPRTEDRRMDDLFSGFSCGDFDKFVWFERHYTVEGWMICEDPRPIERGSRRR